MKIVYNPKDGAPITKYVYLGSLIDPHYPDGYEVNGKRMNGLMQYDDDLADSITEIYTFLQQLSVDAAKRIIDRPEVEKLKCDEPNCDFSTTYAVALSGHKRKHNKEKAIYDETVIPVAGGKRVATRQGVERPQDEELKAGIDADGVEWYGPGATIDNGFSTVPPAGRGHFVG